MVSPVDRGESPSGFLPRRGLRGVQGLDPGTQVLGTCPEPALGGSFLDEDLKLRRAAGQDADSRMARAEGAAVSPFRFLHGREAPGGVPPSDPRGALPGEARNEGSEEKEQERKGQGEDQDRFRDPRRGGKVPGNAAKTPARTFYTNERTPAAPRRFLTRVDQEAREHRRPLLAPLLYHAGNPARTTMRLSLSQNLRAEQRLIQSPQMIQAMQVLQYPLLELKDRIDQELQENVFLDIKEPDPSSEEVPPPEPEPQEEVPPDATFETLDEIEERTKDWKQRGRIGSGVDGDAKLEALANTPGHSESLTDHLMSQLALIDLSPEQREQVEIVILSLDRDGRLISSREELAEEADCSLEEIDEAIRLVQTLDPPGVGAADLEECLLLQLDMIEGEHELARRVIRDHLEDLSMNRIPRIAKKTGATIEEIKECVEFMRKHLHPHPGSQFGDIPNQVISPDIVVEEIDGRFEVRVERGGIPELQISSVYRKLLKESQPDPKVQEYLRKKIEAAKWFIDSIHQRQSTIQRIATAVVEKQSEFLRKGISHLKPLRMQDIADEVGVHISTVSRAISGKYIQTPQGIFDMKRFFSAGTRSESGEMVSQQAIKQRVKEIIEAEDRKRPLSDDAVVQILEKEGVKIARRTVTKYRKALGIPSSTQRREY